MSAPDISSPRDLPSSQSTAASIGSSAALISFFVIISRITGFMRTWAMAFALGSTMLASSYQIANNLPNMLYELVMGGMLVTAFLPVYLSVKNRLGERGGNEYASNIMSIAFILLGSVALLCTLFAPALVFTQSFMSDQGNMDDAVFFFRFFAIQIVFYGLSSIVSGLLNASRDYLWSSAAPIFNNLIVTATFVLYAFVAPSNPDLAKLIIAIGNPLGVFIQMAIQLPALKRNGIKLRFHVDLHDPALKETLAIGVPAILVMCAGLVVVSVQNAASYAVVENGPSIIAYARLWFTLPYAFLTVPITTAMFTEISEMHATGNMSGFKRGLASGVEQILFFMLPFALFLIVFAEPLVTLYHIGAFTEENIGQIALYLAALAVSLPFYGVNTYLQKAFSATRMMGGYAAMMVAAIALQIGFIAVFATPIAGMNFGMPAIALSETVFYVVLDVACFIYLRRKIGAIGLGSMVRSGMRSLALGILGAVAAAGVVFALDATVAPLDGSILHALACIFCGGIVAVAVTFGVAVKMQLDEASMLVSIVGKITRKFGRGNKTAAEKGACDESASGNAVRNEPAHDSKSAAQEPSAETIRRGKHVGVEASVEDFDRNADEEDAPRGKHSAHAVSERKIAGARHTHSRRDRTK
ncbi:MAG: murein biosynthesis integral membrane protein MurJ [Slackia sp.]|nr:murein biosynthesis integral membrane protein MurJ [Slackia sp.]